MDINRNVFREYDIRGIAGKEFTQAAIDEYEKWYGKFPGITITPEAATAIGKAYGTVIRQKGGKRVVVGHEIRPYGEELKMDFVQGLRSTGCDVVDAGESLTPLIYFSTAYYDYDGGVIVTGSHNIYFYNGFKMMGRNVYPIYDQELQNMWKMIKDEKFETGEEGAYEKIDVWPDYKKYFFGHNFLDRKLKVVIDCANGSPGSFVPKLLESFGCEVVGLYLEPNAHFPNHVPDPEDPWMMRDLSAKVIEVGADLGIGYDADGDRFGVVDENGKFVYSDHVLLVLAKDILKRNPGKKIVYDAKCSWLVDTFVKKYGGVPVMHVTGHAPIKATLRNDAETIFAAEVSGHFFFCEDYFRIDDAVYTTGKVLGLLSRSDKKFSELFSEFPKTVMTPELKLPCPDEVKHAIVANVAKDFEDKYKTIKIDGTRIVFSETSWAIVRASNTGPYLTIRVEADTDAEVIKIKNIVADSLEKFGEIGDKLDRTCVTSHTGKLGWL